MDFRIVVCPKCSHKQIVSYITCGTPCHQCHVFLNSIDYHDESRKEYAKGIKEFTSDADKFALQMKLWDDQNKKVEFKTVSIPDETLMKILEG